MSVQTSTSLVQYVGNASTETPYPIPFLFLEDSHLKVIVTDESGSDTTLALGTGYQVSGAGQPQGGSIVTTSELDASHKVTISRDVPATQLTSYAENGEFPAASHERALDKLTMLVQQGTRAKGAALRVPETNGDIAELRPQATSVIGFDGTSQPVTYDSAALVAFLNLTQQVSDRPTKTFVDAGARAAAVPDFLGQVGVQVDDKSLWISTALEAAAWQPVISGTSYNNDAYVIVSTSDSAAANGTALLVAYAAAATLAPGGSALSRTNRACVVVPPGNYDLGTSQLLLDAEFVDLVGLTTNRRVQSIHSTTASAGQGTIRQTANDVVIQNLYLANFASPDASYSSATSAAYFPDSDLPATRLKNVEFYTEDSGVGPFSTRAYVTYSGTYEDCVASNVFAGGAAEGSGTAVVSGIFRRCEGGDFSFAGGAGLTLTGQLFDCEGGLDSFGQNGGSIGSGALLMNCRTAAGSFADSTIISGARVINFIDSTGVHYYPTFPVNSGAVVQKVYAEYTGRANFNSAIPLKDLVPTSLQGAEVLSATITPKYADSKILISFQGFAAGGNMVLALFKGTSTNAIAASDTVGPSGAYPCVVSLIHQDSGGSGPITYKVRAGSSAMHFNGTSSIRLFGGTAKATLILEEIKA
ncbi:hypothetical protein BH09VER1_BH09VER1_49020 [soil metagenome]